jgi:hypothetical protein
MSNQGQGLAPCPCGNQPELVTHEGPTEFWIECPGCCVFRSLDGDTRETARKWNEMNNHLISPDSREDTGGILEV